MMKPITLQTLFDFTPSDLAANRRGEMSPRQLERLQWALDDACTSAAAAIVGAPAVVLLVIAYFYLVIRFGEQLGPAVLLVLVAAFAVAIGIYWVIYTASRAAIRQLSDLSPGIYGALCQRLRRFNAAAADALDAGRVEAVSGVLTIQTDGEHEYIYLDDTEFINNMMAEQDDRLWELEQGQPYTIYYIPGLLWIMSVESNPSSGE